MWRKNRKLIWKVKSCKSSRSLYYWYTIQEACGYGSNLLFILSHAAIQGAQPTGWPCAVQLLTAMQREAVQIPSLVVISKGNGEESWLGSYQIVLDPRFWSLPMCKALQIFQWGINLFRSFTHQDHGRGYAKPSSFFYFLESRPHKLCWDHERHLLQGMIAGTEAKQCRGSCASSCSALSTCPQYLRLAFISPGSTTASKDHN